MNKTTVTTALGGAALAIGVLAACGTSSATRAAPSAPSTPPAAITWTYTPPTATTPAAPPAEPAAPAAPAITTAQQQALDSAQSYLDLGSGFSRAGLIDQLHSTAGEGFSLADATWAADHSGADWNAQAVMSAKGYMDLGTGFSRSGLIDQLTSAYGEQFTLAQATYAVDQVGL